MIAFASWRDVGVTEVPRYDVDALATIWKRIGSPAVQAIRSGALSHVQTPTWRVSEAAIRRVFALERGTHCFDQPPILWANHREPQITCAMRAFLEEGTATKSRKRMAAFLMAAFRCAGRVNDVSNFAWTDISSCESVAEEGRVDLIVEATLGDGRKLGAVVEAKFGHKLTRGQLPKSVRHAQGRGLNESNAAYLIVLPDISDVGTRVFSKPGNKCWRPVSWSQLLLEFERLLPGDADGEAFQSFRHTVWYKAYIL